MGKLQPDYITWTLSLNAGGLQKEILKIKNSSKELKDENKLLKESMKELTQQGKYQGEEYQKLDKQLKANNRIISGNNEKIKHLESRISNVNKSYAQLSKQAKKLQSDLDNTVKALQPEEYARLEAELMKTKTAMEQLRPRTEAVKESFFSLTKMKAAVVGFFAGIGASISSFFINAISEAKEWMKEGINMAANADGVRHAFEKLNRPGLLDDLRKATKNTVNDLELMKAVVLAKDFRIPLEDLGKYLQFAQLKAQETGQSVEYMTNSIVTGLGRKSLMILDNLGLSAAEINEEIAVTGDLMKAVANIVDRQLTQAGNNYISATDRATQETVKFQNQQRKLGEILLPIKEKWDALYGGFRIGIMKIVGWIVEHRASLFTLITAITTYITVQKLSVIWNAKYASSTILAVAAEKLHILQLSLSRKALEAKVIMTELYAGKCSIATAATRMFNLVLKASPLGLIVTLATAAATAIYMYGNRTSIAKKSIADFTESLMVKKEALNNIFEELKKTNPKTEERVRIVKQLNETYPDLIGNYNLETAKLHEITRAQDEANAALTNRIATEMKYKAVVDFLEDNISMQMRRTKMVKGKMKAFMGGEIFDSLSDEMDKFLSDSSKTFEEFMGTFGKYGKMMIEEERTLKNNFDSLREYQKEESIGVNEINKAYDLYLNKIIIFSDESEKKTKDLIAAKKEEIEQTEREIASTPELLKAKNKKIAKLKEELEALQDLGVNKKKKPGDFNSEIDKALAGLDNKHNQELLKIREAKEKEQQTEAQYNKAVLAEDKRYYTERLEALKKLDKTTAKTKLKTLAEIQSKITESNSKLLENQRKHDENEILLLKEQRDKKLFAQEAAYKSAKAQIELDYANQKITQQAREMGLLALEETNTRERLNILKNYQNEVGKTEIQTGNVKVTAVKEAGQAVLEAELANAQSRAKQQKEIESLLSSFKKEFSLTNLPDETDLQLKVLEASYQARLQIIRDSLKQELITKEQAAVQEKALNEAKGTAELNIVKDAENRKNGILEKYGLVGFQQRYNMQMEALRREKQQGLISAEDYAKAEKQLKLSAWKEAYDYYSGLFGDAITALQDAEIANMEAKYDVEIEAAQGNAEEIERLEQEKAEKKLEIEKKYADVQFAVKASQIIANTAMAIMTALAELGPIAGPIAAALMGVTGAAQLSAANAERQKVKNMTLNNSSSSSVSSAERVVNPSSGYSEGGHTGDGGRYEVAGVVHRGEYVVPMPEMKNKRVFNMVKVIESIRRQRTGANPLPGYSEGGRVQDRTTNQVNCPELLKAAERLEKATENLGKPTRSYVLLSDINEAEEIKSKSEKPFTRGDK